MSGGHLDMSFGRFLSTVARRVPRPCRRNLAVCSSILLISAAFVLLILFLVHQLPSSAPPLADVDIDVVVIEEHHEGNPTWFIDATLSVTMVTCHHDFWNLYFGQENRIFLATKGLLWPKICRKCDSERAPLPIPHPTRCLWRLDHRAPWHQILATPLVTTTF